MNKQETVKPGRRKRRSSEEIADRLLQAAREEFADRGFVGATTAASARRADVTEAQLFRHFANKVDLFGEAVFKPLDSHLSQFLAQNLEQPDDGGAQHFRNPSDYIAELRQFIETHSGMLMSLIVAQAYSTEVMPGIHQIGSLEAYFEHGTATMAKQLTKPAKVDPKLMTRVSFAAVLACVLFKDWIFPPGLASAEQINAAISDFVIEGLRANDDPALRRD